MQIVKRIVVSAVVLLSACTEISGGPVEGQLTDKANSQPIEGAVVVVKWDMATGGLLGEKRYYCYHIEAATTDAEGHYRIPKWRIKLGKDETGEQMRWLPNPTVGLEVQALKPGYVNAGTGVSGEPGRIDFKATEFAGTEAEWFTAWEKYPQFDEGCFGGGSRLGVEAVIAVYERFGNTASHKTTIASLKGQLDDPDFGKYGITNRSQRK